MNQISVTLSPTIDIKQGAECVQYLEIVGLVGTLQADSSTLQVTSASAGVFKADATWDKTLGRIKVYLNENLFAGTTYVFSFSIRNSATPSVSGVTVTISVPQISSTLSTMNIQGTLLDIMSSSWTTAGITQTSSSPCAQNIITVSIAASIDVDKECVNRLTISGLRGSTTADASSLALTAGSNNAVFGASGSWVRASGTFVVSIQANFQSSTAITLKFTLQNFATVQVAQVVTLISPAVFPNQTLSGTNIMMVEALSFGSPTGQSSTQYPCAENTITIKIPLSVPLLDTCRAANMVAYNRFPRITMSGFLGAWSSGTPSLSSSTPSLSPFNGVVATFDHLSGIITLAPSAATVAGTDYVFSFTIR